MLAVLLALCGSGAGSAPEGEAEVLKLPGLREPVEVLTDRWGIAHLYARNERDLFFAQGYNAARDRLFQFELWRRQATGTMAEILGPREVMRDTGARLFRFRGDMRQELAHYHPRGEPIVAAFVEGVNAYIRHAREQPDRLPLEFRLLGIEPGLWTPEVVISRHGGLLRNATQELQYGRAVALLGAEKVRELGSFRPGEPVLALDPAVAPALLREDLLGLYSAFRAPVTFRTEDLAGATKQASSIGRAALWSAAPPAAFPFGPAPRLSRGELGAVSSWKAAGGAALHMGWPEPGAARPGSTAVPASEDLHPEDIGSNNWVVSGRRTRSGFPLLANDPHRALQLPSLRYFVHLVAPGWNVIGGGEPVLPGVSIGHNEHGAWGLTVFSLDSEDLYVYDLNPENPLEYRYGGRWEPLRVVRETIPVKGAAPVAVTLKYTRHGPMVFEDAARRKAVALRAGWLEPGCAPYLASLRMDQARSWEEFREACAAHRIPGENMVWADRAGNIGWQAAGLAPARPNWSGLVPVPGDGKYEWRGFLPGKQLPGVLNPEQGFWATANHNLVPPGYPHRNAVGWGWAEPFRAERIHEVLASGRKQTLAESIRLQHDQTSLPARTLIPLLEGLPLPNERARRAMELLRAWDQVLHPDSVAAGIYTAWVRRVQRNVRARVLPAGAQEAFPNPGEASAELATIPLGRVLDWLLAPDGRFGKDPLAGRDALLLESLEQALVDLAGKLGPDMARWQYGQAGYKHFRLRHPLSAAVDEATRARLDLGPVPRGGDATTVNPTGAGDNQTAGASFRVVIDTGDWDTALGTNVPGQSGDPASPHYADLFPLWAAGKYFPLFYSRPRVESVTERAWRLEPRSE